MENWNLTISWAVSFHLWQRQPCRFEAQVDDLNAVVFDPRPVHLLLFQTFVYTLGGQQQKKTKIQFNLLGVRLEIKRHSKAVGTLPDQYRRRGDGGMIESLVPVDSLIGWVGQKQIGTTFSRTRPSIWSFPAGLVPIVFQYFVQVHTIRYEIRNFWNINIVSNPMFSFRTFNFWRKLTWLVETERIYCWIQYVD